MILSAFNPKTIAQKHHTPAVVGQPSATHIAFLSEREITNLVSEPRKIIVQEADRSDAFPREIIPVIKEIHIH